MAIQQVSVTITDTWQKMSVGDCIIQTPGNLNAQVEFAISDTQPDAGTQAFSANFSYPKTVGALKSSVWARVKEPKKTPGITNSIVSVDAVVARELV